MEHNHYTSRELAEHYGKYWFQNSDEDRNNDQRAVALGSPTTCSSTNDQSHSQKAAAVALLLVPSKCGMLRPPDGTENGNSETSVMCLVQTPDTQETRLGSNFASLFFHQKFKNFASLLRLGLAGRCKSSRWVHTKHLPSMNN